MDVDLRKALEDAIDLLEEAGVAYALIGGLAASLRGIIRVTEDVDVVLACDVDEALSVLGSVSSSDGPFTPFLKDPEEVVRAAYLLPLMHQPTGVKVDLSVGLSGFERSAVDEADDVDLKGRTVRVAQPHHLIVMKLLADRPQDVQDIEGLIKADREPRAIDWDTVERLCGELDAAIGTGLLARARRLRP